MPRSTTYSPGAQRPVSEFDAGINSSTAWTEHLESERTPASSSKARSRRYVSESDIPPQSLSEDEVDEEPEIITRPGRALYAFEGKAEFRELCVDPGDELEVIKEDVGEGWSLVKDSTGEIGLLPQTYYTLTTSFTPSPDLQLDVVHETRKREASSSSVTPRPSPRTSRVQESLTSIVPQNTGEWLPVFPSFRQSLMGGKSLNRFSSFVTSGAESFLLHGSPSPQSPLKVSGHGKEETTASMFEASQEERMKLDPLGLSESDRHLIEAGSSGPTWHAKSPTFTVLVYSPSKRTSGLSGAYTVYQVTSIFLSQTTVDWVQIPDPDDPHNSATHDENTIRITVQRRFSQFVMLHTALARQLPGIVLPPLPEKQYAGRFSHDFVEARRGDLERYINKIVRHPIVRYAEVLTFFLSCEDDKEWLHLWPRYVNAPAVGPAFYARIYHPAFNVDAEDAEEVVLAFQRHTKAVGKGIQGLRNVFGKIREARVEMSKAERLLSYSFLSLITSKPLAESSQLGITQDEGGDYIQGGDKMQGLLNSDGAWCWRENCPECLKLTKAVQKTCETLQTVANLYDGHARRTQLATHESLKLMAHPSSLYESTTITHKSTLTRYRESIGKNVVQADEELATRCETVLNTTMAEMDVYHQQKVEDLKNIVTDHLDGEIAFYEQILNRLKAARATYIGTQYTDLGLSPRLPSIYERDLSFDPSNPRAATNQNAIPRPLPQPCPHVFDSTPMRPVTAAIQEGVGIFLRNSNAGRGSVFSRFW